MLKLSSNKGFHFKYFLRTTKKNQCLQLKTQLKTYRLSFQLILLLKTNLSTKNLTFKLSVLLKLNTKCNYICIDS